MSPFEKDIMGLGKGGEILSYQQKYSSRERVRIQVPKYTDDLQVKQILSLPFKKFS